MSTQPISRNQFPKQFTEDLVIELLNKVDFMTTNQVYTNLKCSDVTAMNILQSLFTKAIVNRRNVGTDKRPRWIWFINKRLNHELPN